MTCLIGSLPLVVARWAMIECRLHEPSEGLRGIQRPGEGGQPMKQYPGEREHDD